MQHRPSRFVTEGGVFVCGSVVSGGRFAFGHLQIELVQPKVIVLLGAVPLLHLMHLKGISRLRGTWLDYNGIKVMPTYHPAYLLRNANEKINAWKDLQMVMKVFGKTPPPPRSRRTETV